MTVQTLLTCPKCHRQLPSDLANVPEMGHCPACNTALHLSVFPALYQPLTAGSMGDKVVLDNEASCFYHPQRKAVIPCDSCGRFLCALCDIELQDQHLCSNCLESGKKKGTFKHLDNQRMLYDTIALRLAVYPLVLFFFWFFTIITAPIAIIVSIRYWNAPSSLLPRTKARFIIAILLAGIQIAVWGYMILQWYLLINA